MAKQKLAIILGGVSTEHDVSVVSGTSVIQNLEKDRYDIYPIYISQEGKWYRYTKPVEQIQVVPIGTKLEELEAIDNVMEYLQTMDIAFPVLHGLGGEDGSIQGLFTLLHLPYVGCGILASSVGMDKVYTKAILEKAKIRQTKHVYIQVKEDGYDWVEEDLSRKKESLETILTKIEETISYPMFIKPSNSGSSVGVKKASNKEELRKAIEFAAQFDQKVLVEQGIIGREIECAVLGTKDVIASHVGEILSAEEFYSFDAKYTNAESKTIIPAKIAPAIQEEIQELAKKAFQAIDGSGLARVDFFVEDKTNMVYLNEINTMPGFTTISMYPKLMEEMGISYPDLLNRLIALAKTK